MPDIFDSATTCSTNCVTTDYVVAQLDPCAGAIFATKKVKVGVFKCDTAAASFATIILIQGLIGSNDLRILYAENFVKDPEAAIKVSIDPKQPDQTIGYNGKISFSDVKWQTAFENIDTANEIAAKILKSHLFFVDEDDELYFLRTNHSIELANPYTSGETDYKKIDYVFMYKYFLKDLVQPSLNKPTVLAGLYASL